MTLSHPLRRLSLDDPPTATRGREAQDVRGVVPQRLLEDRGHPMAGRSLSVSASDVVDQPPWEQHLGTRSSASPGTRSSPSRRAPVARARRIVPRPPRRGATLTDEVQ